MSDEWAWLKDRPVFTTRGEKGGAVTRVPHGAVLAPVRAGLALTVIGLALSAGLMIAGIGLVIAGGAEDLAAARWWWLALSIPAGVIAVVLFAGVYVTGTEVIMRSRPRNMLLVTALLGAVAVGLGVLAAWWFWRADTVGLHPELLARPGRDGELRALAQRLAVGALVAALACLGGVLIARRAVRRARSDVARIIRLRRTGARHRGVITALPDPREWHGGGDVPIRYADENGEQVVSVRLNTYAHEIPVPGTPVVVFTDGGGDLLVELDPDHPVQDYPDNRPYEPNTGGGTM
jgi:hypothetical protein